MPPEFVTAHSELSSLQQLVNASPFTISSVEDFKAIPDDAWDSFIGEKTSFNTWRAMQEAAVKEWTRKKLGLGDSSTRRARYRPHPPSGSEGGRKDHRYGTILCDLERGEVIDLLRDVSPELSQPGFAAKGLWDAET